MPNSQEKIRRKIIELGPWFHQIEIAGLKTRTIAPAPGFQHSDHPRSRWAILKKAIPANLTGKRVLDVGCSDGFFALEMAKRGAQVTAIDYSDLAIRRLNWVIAELGVPNITTRVAKFETLAASKARYDFVLMIALLYHLRSPMNAFDIMRRLTDKIYVETVVHGTNEAPYLYLQPPIESVIRVPKWIPTERCVLNMLRFAGFSRVRVLQRARSNRGIYMAQGISNTTVKA
jgi:tRNA (mo5U34)-methyltransferase